MVTFIGADFFQDRSSIIIATEFMDFYSLKDIAAQCGNFFFQKKSLERTCSHNPNAKARQYAALARTYAFVHTSIYLRECTQYMRVSYPPSFLRMRYTQEEEEEEMLPQSFL